jgi:hypothetical protein
MKRDLLSAALGPIVRVLAPVLDAWRDETTPRMPRPVGRYAPRQMPESYYRSTFAFSIDPGEDLDDGYSAGQYLEDVAALDAARWWPSESHPETTEMKCDRYQCGYRYDSVNPAPVPCLECEGGVARPVTSGTQPEATTTLPSPREEPAEIDEDGDTLLEPTPLLVPEDVPVSDPVPPEYGDPVGGHPLLGVLLAGPGLEAWLRSVIG